MIAKARRRRGDGSGAPAWIVTFADLMSILVCFFVLIISFSIQDKEKLQIVAGSMREAFGVRSDARHAGMIEIEGVPVRDHVRDVSPLEQSTDADFAAERHNDRSLQGPEANTHDIAKAEEEEARMFTTAAASLRQAWQDRPEIAEISRQIMIEETEEGLNIQLVDQDGRTMFAEGSAQPHAHTRRILETMGPVLQAMPHRIRVTGHTTSGAFAPDPAYTNWELSADRANAARQILAAHGIAEDRFHSVVGKADAEPLFPNDPFLASNRRISILLMSEAPPLPATLRP